MGAGGMSSGSVVHDAVSTPTRIFAAPSGRGHRDVPVSAQLKGRSVSPDKKKKTSPVRRQEEPIKGHRDGMGADRDTCQGPFVTLPVNDPVKKIAAPRGPGHRDVPVSAISRSGPMRSSERLSPVRSGYHQDPHGVGADPDSAGSVRHDAVSTRQGIAGRPAGPKLPRDFPSPRQVEVDRCGHRETVTCVEA
jgi:hypothetical protein